MAIWINGKEYISGGTVVGDDYIAAGAGTPNVIDQSGGDVYITDDLEVDGTTTLDGALVAKSTVTVDAGVIATGTNTDLQLLPNGTGIVKVGDAGTPSNLGTPTNDDLFVSGRLEVDEATTLDGELSAKAAITVDDDVPVYLGTSADSSIEFDATGQTADCMVISVDTTSKNVVIGDIANAGKDYDHAASASPHLWVQSQTDPDSANDEWVSFTHDVTNGVIQTGSGNLTIGSGTTSNSLNANGDLFVSGKIEADGRVYADAGAVVATSQSLSFGVSSTTYSNIKSRTGALYNGTIFYLGSAHGRKLFLADSAHSAYPYENDDKTNPTYVIQSARSPVETSVERVEYSHDGDDAVFSCVHGGYSFGTADQAAP